MIIYLHGFDSTSPGNHEKILQLQFIDDDVRFINYSTLHPKHDMQHLLKEVHKVIEQSDDEHPIICGVGLGGFWSERIGFLCGIKQVIFNPNLHPENNMEGRIDRPEEYLDIATKCVDKFREKNKNNCLVIMSKHNAVHNNLENAKELEPFYDIIWDEKEPHKFKKISQHLQAIKAFKEA
ncbi:alpha/beta hydrolase YcfP [Vibrio sp. SCSIO 43136]|uniref:alpha/beta hydrolase YcfP n=1 Tax=Vibrio sp. SCSIO 43136 TaxID=2819101 RepID=UPI00207546AE|nr:alpha/beta hydrolase YcfP [Vibrio sp. SCSIO 43136]USD66198.1 alpha/beta hydrolase [Vibrio sp. SCSIO 43136]